MSDDERREGQKSRALARRVVARLDDEERTAVLAWLQSLLELRSARLPLRRKIRKALARTETRSVVSALSRIGGPLKDLAWDDRTWASRFGLSAAAVAALTTTGQGAGIALLGTAIGVPLWVVIGAGGSFAGILIDELTAARDKNRVAMPDLEDEEPEIPEAEWALDDPEATDSRLPVLASSHGEITRELRALGAALQEVESKKGGTLVQALGALRGRRKPSIWSRLRRKSS